MRSFALLAAVVAAVAVPATALAKGKILFADTVPSGRSSSITFDTHQPASFRVVLHVPTQGRAQLFLTGRTAPRGGPLIDTKKSACDGAAGSFYCRGSYERLPAGTYTWRIAWVGVARIPANVELTVRW